MRWDNLQILLAISREGSLTQAAHFLGLDQSTAGRRLSQLEAELGVVLFVRSKSGFAPTLSGETAIAHAKKVEASINNLVDDVPSKSHSAVGTVRLLGNAWTLERLTNLTVAPFLAENPDLSLRTISLLRNSHIRGEASVGLWFEKAAKFGEIVVKLGDIEYAVYQSKQNPAETDWVVFYDEDITRTTVFSSTRKFMGTDDKIRLTSTDAGVLRAAIAAGVGRGLLPMCMAENDPRLERVNTGPAELTRTLWMQTHPDTIETKRIQVTLDWLRGAFTKAFSV